jgi:hypothetical protein
MDKKEYGILQKLRKGHSAQKTLLFSLYSWITTIGWGVLDMCPPVIRHFFFKIRLGKLGRCTFIDYKSYMRYMKRISVGSNSFIGRGCAFFPCFVYKDIFISIGNNVLVGPGVTFLTYGHDHTSLDVPDIAGNIIVKDNVWIGMGSTIVGSSGGGGGLLSAREPLLERARLSLKMFQRGALWAAYPQRKLKTVLLIPLPLQAAHKK